MEKHVKAVKTVEEKMGKLDSFLLFFFLNY